MAMKDGQSGYAYVMLRENNEVRMRRIRSVQVQADTGEVSYFSGDKIPFNGVVLDCGDFNRKSGGVAQILGVRSTRTIVDRGPAWPAGRAAVIALAIMGILHALSAFTSALYS